MLDFGIINCTNTRWRDTCLDKTEEKVIKTVLDTTLNVNQHSSAVQKKKKDNQHYVIYTRTLAELMYQVWGTELQERWDKQENCEGKNNRGGKGEVTRPIETRRSSELNCNERDSGQMLGKDFCESE